MHITLKRTTSVSRMSSYCMQIFTKTYLIPNLASQSDIAEIEETLQGSPGIGSFEFDLPSHRLTVVTENQDGGKDIEFLLRDMGFPPEAEE